jgi:hypothetical protein
MASVGNSLCHLFIIVALSVVNIWLGVAWFVIWLVS